MCAIVLAIYLPDIGHGFIKDDFRWIRASRISGAADAEAIFRSNIGFYRPLTALTFAADHAIYGMAPFGYGATNLLLLALAACLLFALARTLRLSESAALFGAAIWTLNFHAVNMALLWISGRTALLVTVFSLAAAHAVLRRRAMVAGLFALAAMLCKEEAVVLPLLFAAFLMVESRRAANGVPPLAMNARSASRDGRGRSLTMVMSQCWAMAVALMVYAALRLQSGAFGALDAPSYYRFSFSPALVLRNILEYADRAGTATALAVIILLAACGWRRQPLMPAERRAMVLGAIWVPATYVLTVFLPVRSSLYALLPAVGTALAGAAVASVVSRAAPQRFRRAAIALIAVSVLLIPVYRLRNERWVRLADTSSTVMTTIAASVESQAGVRVVLIENPAADVTLDSAFGTLFPDAVALVAGEHATGEIVQPGDPIASGATHVYRLVDGRLTQIDP